MFGSPDVWKKPMREPCQDGFRAAGWALGTQQQGCESDTPLGQAYHRSRVCTSLNMSCFRKSPCCVMGGRRFGVVRAVVLGLFSLFSGIGLAHAQPTTSTQPQTGASRGEGGLVSSAPAQASPDAPPSPAEAMVAYRVVSRYVRSWTVPRDEAITAQGEFEDTDSPPVAKVRVGDVEIPSYAKLKLPRATAANVVLRFGGEVVGRGEASADDVMSVQSGDPRVLLRATRDAMTEAVLKLPLKQGPGRDESLRKMASELAISIELAGRFTPLEAATWAEAELSLAPGLDGICVSVPSTEKAVGKSAVEFPTQMLMRNILPHRAIAVSAAQVIGEGGAAAALDEPKIIRERHGVRMSRFRVVHLSQAGPGKEPEFLYRGSRLVPWQRAMTRDELWDMGKRLGTHLALRQQTVEPEAAAASTQENRKSTILQDPSIERSGMASDVSQALAAVALQRAAQVNLVAPEAWHALRAYFEGKDEAISPTAKRFLHVSGAWPFGDGAFISRLSGIPLGERGIAALGYRPLGYSGVEDPRSQLVVRETAARELEACMLPALSAQDADLLSALPWAGWGALAVADARHDERVAKLSGKPKEWEGAASRVVPVESEDIPGAARLRELRSATWKHQFSISSSGSDAQDLTGGIVFTKGLTDGRGTVLPTWQCARPLAFIATMLREPRLTEPQERTKELVQLMSALRYLRQLQVDDSNAWMYSEPGKAMGAIRASVWDKSLPLDASSMTLLCVVEAIKSLDALTADAQTPAKTSPDVVPASPERDSAESAGKR